MTTTAATEFARCRHWLEDAIAHGDGEITIEDVIARIEGGAMHFWPGKQCACVTEFTQFPRKRYLNITLAGGDMDEILAMVPSFQAFGKVNGCDKLVEVGRPGWEKVLKSRGWKKAAIVLTLPVEETARR